MSAFYRLQLPLRELAARGDFGVTFADAGDSANTFSGRPPPPITLSRLRGHDVVVAQRWNKHKGLEVFRRASQFAKLVYELDDDVFAITPENWGAYRLYGQPDIRDAIAHSLACADLITVSTQPLADSLRPVIAEAGNPDPRIVVLPNCIPGWALGLPPRTVRDRPRVGWQGGASHAVDIGIAVSPVRRFLRRFPDWDLHLVGTDYRATFKVAKDRAFYSPWIRICDDAAGFYKLMDYDIALAPLRPTPFTRAKSALKAIEHGARGIPTIATDCEAYRAVITDGVDGFLVKHDHEWLSRLSELASDDALRAKMSENAREMAKRHLIEDGYRTWADAYTGLFR